MQCNVTSRFKTQLPSIGAEHRLRCARFASCNRTESLDQIKLGQTHKDFIAVLVASQNEPEGYVRVSGMFREKAKLLNSYITTVLATTADAHSRRAT